MRRHLGDLVLWQANIRRRGPGEESENLQQARRQSFRAHLPPQGHANGASLCNAGILA